MDPDSHKPTLLELLHASFERNLLDGDALSMIEGALSVSDMQVRDVMVPRAQMDVLSVADSMAKITGFVIEATHSRYPVVGENRDDVIGILLAKELLSYIEDVLEQIVGDIEDEYDFDESIGNIVLDNAGRYRVKATTEIADFNTAFATAFSDEDYDTVGGLVIHQLGRLPKRNEVVVLDGLRLQVLRADSRRVHTLLVDQQRSLALNSAE